MEPPRCPITLDFMRDPVSDCNGHTYERSAITAWYAMHNTSPVTGATVFNKNLTPNYVVKQLMEEYYKGLLSNSAASSQTQTNANQAVITPKKPNLPELTITSTLFQWLDKKYLNIKLSNPNDFHFQRMPVSCIAVIDVSGSMGDRATPYNPNGENDGFSRLDLVKHSLNTIYKSLSPELGDKLSIITFNASATLVLPLTSVGNTARINDSIESLSPGGNTNIWAGLQMAIQMADTLNPKMENINVLLLTDGVSNYNPPRGIIPTFNGVYKAGRYPIHTFAYGYEVDSEVVASIATKSNGIFGYIPDGTMVGTIFINTMSNILATVYNNICLELKTKSSDKLEIINIGNIAFGQTRNIILEYNFDNPVEYFNLSYNDFYSTKNMKNAKQDMDDESIIIHMASHDIINILKSFIIDYTNSDNSARILQSFITQYSPYVSVNSFIQDIITDCKDEDVNKGQIGKSIENRKWYDKWGRHYLRSLIRAYQLEMCLNFKDLAPIHYAGDEFKKEQQRIELIFNGITPPPPSIIDRLQSGQNHYFNSTNASTTTPTPSYASIPQSYYNVSGGCFTDNWNVVLPGNMRKPVASIRPGDIVVSNDSPTGLAKIICVVRLAIHNTLCMISPDGNSGITAYHPVWLSSELTTIQSQPQSFQTSDTHYSVMEPKNWMFPESITEKFIIMHKGEYMYDFVIDNGYSVALEGSQTNRYYNVACLGHDCTDNSIIQHEYFGTHRIIDDLKDHENWINGYITLEHWDFKRGLDGRVLKLEF